MHVRLIRHGITAGNAARRYVGVTDEPLSPEGRAQAEQKEKDFSPERIYVSPLKRARETAAILFPNAEQVPVYDLREMDFGVFEGRTADEMADDPVYRAWVDDLCRGTCPGGESQADFHRRTVAAFSDVMRKTAGDTTFVVHGGVIMALMSNLGQGEFYDFLCGNGAGYVCDWRGGRLTLEEKLWQD